MPERPSIARLFWIAGGVLATGGLVLWWALPIRPMFPPYFATALVAIIYAELRRRRPADPKP